MQQDLSNLKRSLKKQTSENEDTREEMQQGLINLKRSMRKQLAESKRSSAYLENVIVAICKTKSEIRSLRESKELIKENNE